MKMLISAVAAIAISAGFAATAHAQSQVTRYLQYGERVSAPMRGFNGQLEYPNNGYNGGYSNPYYENETSGGRTKVERDPGRRQQYCKKSEYGPSGWVAYGVPCPTFRITQYPDGRIVREIVSGQ